MGFENKSGLNVSNHYGPRATGGSVGLEHSSDSTQTLSLYLTAKSVNDGFLPPVVIPAGARFIEGFITVEEAFVGPTVLEVGAKGAETTNGVDIVVSAASLGTKAIAVADTNGTWAFNSTGGTATAAKVGIAKTGTATAGKATLTLKYYYKDRG